MIWPNVSAGQKAGRTNAWAVIRKTAPQTMVDAALKLRAVLEKSAIQSGAVSALESGACFRLVERNTEINSKRAKSLRVGCLSFPLKTTPTATPYPIAEDLRLAEKPRRRLKST